MQTLTEMLNARRLPALLRGAGGEPIVTAEAWETAARPYWLQTLLREEYGKLPPRLSPEITTSENNIDFAGKAVWQTVSFRFSYGGREHTVPTQLIYPVGAKATPHPFFVYLNFRPDIPDRYLPVEELIDRGYGIFTVCYHDITRDDADFTNGMAGLFFTGERAPDEAGKITYWAQMASYMLDYLLTRPEADPAAIGVAGHSRLGKTALLASAIDTRFAFSCANDSGCSGAAPARGRAEGGESIRAICSNFPYWFCPNYQKYIDNETAMPFDQHALIALSAPRIVYVGGAIEALWADNDGQFLACAAASPVWALYGKQGLLTPDSLPVCGDTRTEGNVGFHLRAGKHYHSRTDWLIYMAALDCRFGKRETR